jgi:hypothetical protein
LAPFAPFSFAFSRGDCYNPVSRRSALPCDEGAIMKKAKLVALVVVVVLARRVVE